MNSLNFEEIEEQFIQIIGCLPSSFGNSLPPRLRLRYFKLINEITDFPKRIMKFKALVTATEYREPDWLKKALSFPEKPAVDFLELYNAFQAMQHSLPDKYVDELPDEYRSQYYKILEKHADLQARFSLLAQELQKKGVI